MGSGDLTSLIPGQGGDRPGEEVVTAKEFDLTQVAKQLALAIPIVVGGVLGALKLLGVDDVFTNAAYVVAALGVTAAGVLGLAVVAAADILGRSYSEATRTPTTAASDSKAESDGDFDQERQDRLDKERQDRQDRLDKDRQDREDRLEKERQDRRDRLDKDRQDREDRLEKDRLEREDAQAKARLGQGGS